MAEQTNAAIRLANVAHGASALLADLPHLEPDQLPEGTKSGLDYTLKLLAAEIENYQQRSRAADTNR